MGGAMSVHCAACKDRSPRAISKDAKSKNPRTWCFALRNRTHRATGLAMTREISIGEVVEHRVHIALPRAMIEFQQAVGRG